MPVPPPQLKHAEPPEEDRVKPVFLDGICTIEGGHEHESIANMLKWAGEYHLQEEVVLALFHAVKAQPDIELHAAIYEALYEWDL